MKSPWIFGAFPVGVFHPQHPVVIQSSWTMTARPPTPHARHTAHWSDPGVGMPSQGPILGEKNGMKTTPNPAVCAIWTVMNQRNLWIYGDFWSFNQLKLILENGMSMLSKMSDQTNQNYEFLTYKTKNGVIGQLEKDFVKIPEICWYCHKDIMNILVRGTGTYIQICSDRIGVQCLGPNKPAHGLHHFETLPWCENKSNNNA